MKYLTLFFLIVSSFSVFGQENQITAEIRKLEEMECKATLKKDTAVLSTLWGSDFTVNAPINRVVKGGKNALDRPVINQANYESFDRVVENVLLKGNIAIAMGNELVVNAGNKPVAERTVKRRYSNIWMQENGSWKLIARHANVICTDK